MKTLTAAVIASAFIASPVFACSWNKTAEKESSYTAKAEETVSEEAMTTYDPAKPAFEDKAEMVDSDETIEEDAE